MSISGRPGTMPWGTVLSCSVVPEIDVALVWEPAGRADAVNPAYTVLSLR